MSYTLIYRKLFGNFSIKFYKCFVIHVNISNYVEKFALNTNILKFSRENIPRDRVESFAQIYESAVYIPVIIVAIFVNKITY